jgi:hypothetical protein
MADISSPAPTTIRRLKLPRLRLPKLAIGASLAAISGLVGDAFKLACVDPYAKIYRQPPIVPDEDLGGRDPSW